MWNVYHFRGGMKATFRTEQEAIGWINRQPIPSEYFKSFVELNNDHTV